MTKPVESLTLTTKEFDLPQENNDWNNCSETAMVGTMKNNESGKLMNVKSFLITLPVMVAFALTGCSPQMPASPAVPETSQSASQPSTSAPIDVPAPTASESTKSTTQTVAKPEQGTQAVEALDKLQVADEANSDSYEREKFNHWVSKNPSGCDTRFAVLVSESIVKTKISGCTVISGEWKSVYDGQTVTDPKKLDIDHMVPLKEAWESGASKWDAAKREAYANDLDFAPGLVAVTAASNRSKSDRDPAGYLPTDTSNRCAYVANWIAVKTKWNLSIDSAEKTAIRNQLNSCATGEQIPSVTAVPSTPASGIMGGNPTNGEASKDKVLTPAPPAAAAGPAGSDPKFTSCAKAIAGGYGPYVKGQPEYEWYRDGDGDGKVCEK